MEMLELPFMRQAFEAAFLVSLCVGIIGSLIVTNKMVFLSGGIAHGSYGGIGLAIYFGVAPLLGASVFAVLLCIIIAFVSYRNRDRTDTFIGAMWALGMSVGIIFTDLTPGYNVDLMSYLFGSIISVSKQDLTIMALFDLLILFFISLYHKEFLAVSYDSEFAKLRGVKDKFLYYSLIILIGIGVIVTIRAVGLILVIALMSIPPYMAEKISASFYKMMAITFLLTLVFMFTGLSLSYKFDISSGATIILVAALSFFIFNFIIATIKK